MKRITLTSILTLCMACPAMADIAKNANSATCDSSTIGTTTGPANLQADWTANTIHLDWYSNDSKLTVGTTSATCTYDGGITLPSTPTAPTGYQFAGWKVKQIFNLSTLNKNTNGSFNSYIGFNDGDSSGDVAKYGLTTPGEWAVEFGYGIVKGMARCSTIGNGYSQNQIGAPTDNLNVEGAGYCWCHITGFDAEKNGNYIDVSPSLWVYISDKNPADYCTYSCASTCAEGVERNYYGIRPVLYGISQ